MSTITYTQNRDGTLTGRWFGKSYRQDGKVLKENHKYLGKVVDKEKLIFYKKSEGVYVFCPEDCSTRAVSTQDVPVAFFPDAREQEPNVIISFGGAYFLDRLIHGIGYTEVLATLDVPNTDTLYSMLMFRLLSPDADVHAERWYKNNYARFLYPRANLASQRISEFFVNLENPNMIRRFFQAHMDYVAGATNDCHCIIIDSTGCPNACNIALTKTSRHENVVNIEFRIIFVVHRSTGLPIYYEIIPGNIVDSTTLDSIVEKMSGYGFNVTLVSGDAGYSTPGNIERLILRGSDLLFRLNPTYNLYKKALEDHFAELTVESSENTVRYGGRIIKVIKVPTTVATDPETGDKIEGFIFLCRDISAYFSKAKALLKTKKFVNSNTVEEIMNACSKLGIFALVDTRDISPEDAVPEYYIRQNVEQFIDTDKNCGKLMPIRKHGTETIHGHVHLAFIAGFLSAMIRNRLNIIDIPYVAIPEPLRAGMEAEDSVEVEMENDQKEVVVSQPRCTISFKPSPGALYSELNMFYADVFEQEDKTTKIVPSVYNKEVRDFFSGFGLIPPRKVVITSGGVPIPYIDPRAKETCSKAKAFAVRPVADETTIEEKRRTAEQKKLQQLAEKQGILLPGDPAAGTPKTASEVPVAGTPKTASEVPGGECSKPEKKRGRPPGSKNKKTLEREAAAQQAEET